MTHGGRFAEAFDLGGTLSKDDVLKVLADIEKTGGGKVTRGALIRGLMSAGRSKVRSERKASGVAPERSGRSTGTDLRDVERPHRHGFEGGPGGFGGGLGNPGFRGPGPFGPPSARMLMERFDKDNKGVLTKADVPEFVWNRISRADANNDATVTKDELETYFKARRAGGRPSELPSKPEGKPGDVQPQEQKPTDSKPSAQNSDADQPADATAVTNVGLIFSPTDGV